MQPKVLIFDIETSPNIAYIWNKYEQNAIGDFIRERMIISIAWKWFDKKEFHVKTITDFYGYKKNPTQNKKLIEFIHSLFFAADILVAQNGDNFDIKMCNSEFVQYGLKPPQPHRTIDTLKVARRRFRFNSNKLDDIGARLGLGRKIKTGGFDLWVDCLNGKKSAWDKMKKYNIQDVVLLEKIYIKLKPWMTNHPNMNVLDAHPGCSQCKSTNIHSHGWQLTEKGRRKRYQCNDCGAWMRGPYTSAGLLLS